MLLAGRLTNVVWRKSSYSSDQGACVEIGRLPGTWRKSSHSSDQGECVEIAVGDDAVGVRDSKHATGPVLVFPVTAWRDLRAGL